MSCPFLIQRGIRQGCLITGQLYSLAIEPVLNNLRGKKSGIGTEILKSPYKITLSACTDDVTVFINKINDVTAFSDALKVFERASSAKVNWGESEVLGGTK